MLGAAQMATGQVEASVTTLEQAEGIQSTPRSRKLLSEALTTVEFTRTVAESLAPGGLYILNCGDGPALTGARAEASALLEVFEYVCIVADSAMLKGRRRGNVIIAGSHAPLPEAGSVQAAAIARELMGGGVPAQYWDTARVRQFVR